VINDPRLVLMYVKVCSCYCLYDVRFTEIANDNQYMNEATGEWSAVYWTAMVIRVLWFRFTEL